MHHAVMAYDLTDDIDILIGKAQLSKIFSFNFHANSLVAVDCLYNKINSACFWSVTHVIGYCFSLFKWNKQKSTLINNLITERVRSFG